MSIPVSGIGPIPGIDVTSEPRTLARLEAVAHALAASTALGVLVSRPYPLLVQAARGDTIVLVAPTLVWDGARDLLAAYGRRLSEGTALVVLLGRPSTFGVDDAVHLGIASVLGDDATEGEAALAVLRAFELMEARRRALQHERSSMMYGAEVEQLLAVTRALTTERDVDKLLSIILETARSITNADAGSLYVVEAQDADLALRFKIAQNDSVSFNSKEFVMPITKSSIAGSAVLDRRMINIADVYDLPPGSSFGFNKSFDAKIGYRTKSMLTAPLISQRDEVIGVVQIINRKRVAGVRLGTPADVEQQVEPFDFHGEQLLSMLAAQAGASLETALLYEEIRQLFEGFVRASVEAIESRDPTTSGHSRRVADYTLELAQAVGSTAGGTYGGVSFTNDELREIEYASLLHDFGKIGVRERVLVKAKKLYDDRLEIIGARFDYVRRATEANIFRKKLDAIDARAPREQLEALDVELHERTRQVEEAFATILAANEPTVLQAGDFARIAAIAAQTYVDARGEEQPLLTREEVEALSIKRGTLTAAEYDEIRSHVSHTYRFLSRIPWGKALRKVPLIAGAHHERVNGTGYPSSLKGDEVPVQSRMMSVADIFDALTAADRPYKKAVPLERALDILHFEVKDGNLDGELVRIFKDARVWDRAADRRRSVAPRPLVTSRPPPATPASPGHRH